MFVRALAWHAILVAAPTWRRAKRRDAMQGTFIGVLMSSTLPARLGEPSRALIVARRLGRARETLPVVLGTMVSQTLLNLLALSILGGVTLSSVSVLDGHDRSLLLVALAPLVALLAVLLAPVIIPSAADRSQIGQRSRRLQTLLTSVRRSLLRLRDGLRVFRQPRRAALATVVQLGAWALQWMSCWLLLMALGLDSHAGVAARRRGAVRRQRHRRHPRHARQRRRLPGRMRGRARRRLPRLHPRTPSPMASSFRLVEVAAALIMGLPALLNEGLSWKDVRLRTMHATPVRLPVLPESQYGVLPGE